MSANTFGNAGFSVLLPGARLEGRCGPTNARLPPTDNLLALMIFLPDPSLRHRAVCSTVLIVPLPGCELVVGARLLWTDSFLTYSGSPEDGPRVVFIVDLWHPNVAGAERQALDFVFAPDP
uniref:Aspartate beta-hydroxylase domain containing 1 n=1 Tax=Macaca nemestrina TaxID=9545 RepID=A0A2K6AZX8_MACNE